MTVDDFLGRLRGVTPAGERAWMACCPAHEDKTPSLSVRVIDANGKIGVKCFAGCAFESIAAAVGAAPKDFMGEDSHAAAAAVAREKRKGPKKKIVATYDYQDAEGRTLFQVVRYEPKTFSQRVPDPDRPKGWLWGRSRYGVAETIYRLPKVLAAAREGKRVLFVVEGEKDVAALEGLGCVATCNPGGAGKWRMDFGGHFAGARLVVVIADNDAGPECGAKEFWQGQRHATAVLESLRSAGVECKALTMPEIGGKAVKDAADWIAAGGDKAALWEAVQAAPEWPSETYRAAGDSAPLPPEEAQAGKVEVVGKTDAVQKGEVAGVPIDAAKPLWELVAKVLFKSGPAQERKLSPLERRDLISETVIAWLLQRGRFFWHAELRDHASSMFFEGKLNELMLIESDRFGSWLALESEQNRTGRDYQHAFSDVLDTALCGETSRGIIPEAYWARRGDAVYLSCGDGRMAKIAEGGVTMVPNGTDDVLFAVGKTLAPWKLLDGPGVDPFATWRIFRGAACDDHGRMLLRLWTLSLAACHKCKPPLVLAGGIGSGKTRTAVGIFELLGITPRVSAIVENGEGDFWTSLDYGGLCCFDNADTRVQWLPDAMAAASTDGTHEKRRMYSDSDLIQQRARASLVVTSSNATFASDAGLADRLIVVRLDRRNSDTAESALSVEIAAHRDEAMTWYARTIAVACARDAGARVMRARDMAVNRRHPDFGAFALRCGAALGCEDAVADALKGAEEDKSRFALENDLVGSMLMEVMDTKAWWEGTSAELGTMLCDDVPGLDERVKRDMTGRKLGRRLERLWPHMEAYFGARKRTLQGRVLYGFGGRKVEEVEENKGLELNVRQKKGRDFSENSHLNPPLPPIEAFGADLIPIDLDDYKLGREW